MIDSDIRPRLEALLMKQPPSNGDVYFPYDYEVTVVIETGKSEEEALQACLNDLISDVEKEVAKGRQILRFVEHTVWGVTGKRRTFIVDAEVVEIRGRKVAKAWARAMQTQLAGASATQQR